MITLVEERFWKKVYKTRKCWNWTGSRGRYAQIYVSGWPGRKTFIGVHRFSWTLHFGSIPAGTQILHRCDNPICVRPSHLFLGTQLDNMRDKYKKGRDGKNPVKKGEKHWNVKLSAGQVIDIRRRGVSFRGESALLAKKFGVSKTHINRILRGDVWK